MSSKTRRHFARCERSFRVWANPRCLVAPGPDARRPNYELAAARLETIGWPVRLRRSGGLAVPHGPGTLCVGIAFTGANVPPAEAAFADLANLVMGALSRLGLAPAVGKVPDAVCPGSWDISVAGRKVAGLAQRRRFGGSRTAASVLVHGVIFCGIDLEEAVAAVNAYHDLLGEPRAFKASSHANVGSLAEMWLLARSLKTEALNLDLLPIHYSLPLPPDGGIEGWEE